MKHCAKISLDLFSLINPLIALGTNTPGRIVAILEYDFLRGLSYVLSSQKRVLGGAKSATASITSSRIAGENNIGRF